MSNTKTDNSFELLNPDCIGRIANQLTLKEINQLLQVSSYTFTLFQSDFLKHRGARYSYYCDYGDRRLLNSIPSNPSVLFEKRRIVDHSGRIFNHISPYQFLLFLSDLSLIQEIRSILPKKLIPICKNQEQEMGRGGCDLIKLQDAPNLNNIIEVTTTFDLISDVKKECTVPLLENQDGIIYYKKDNVAHFYYANPSQSQLVKLDLISEEYAQAFEAFKLSFEGMECNTGRRSSDAEHQLIKNVFGCSLVRQGIQYTDNGIQYTDSCHPFFELINAYKSYMRIYDLESMDKTYEAWIKIGVAQSRIIWIIQVICSSELFFPINTTAKAFDRSMKYFDPIGMETRFLIEQGVLSKKLGVTFTLFKGYEQSPISIEIGGDNIPWIELVRVDLIGVCRYIMDAKANIFNWDDVVEPTQHRTPVA